MQAGMRDSFPSYHPRPREILGDMARLALLEKQCRELDAALAKETASRNAFQAKVEPHMWALEWAGTVKESAEKVMRRAIEGALWFGLMYLVARIHLGG